VREQRQTSTDNLLTLPKVVDFIDSEGSFRSLSEHDFDLKLLYRLSKRLTILASIFDDDRRKSVRLSGPLHVQPLRLTVAVGVSGRGESR
jgi:hypothetical protein